MAQATSAGAAMGEVEQTDARFTKLELLSILTEGLENSS